MFLVYVSLLKMCIFTLCINVRLSVGEILCVCDNCLQMWYDYVLIKLIKLYFNNVSSRFNC